MRDRRVIVVVALLAVAVVLALYLRRGSGEIRYTGFVEGEERVLRSEVTGRVLEVAFGEGASVPAGAVVARLDDRDIRAKIDSKRREVGVLDATIGTQEERIALTEATWARDLDARKADVRLAQSAASLAERSFARERDLVSTGASTAQILDDALARRDQAASSLERAKQMLARTEAEERSIALAQHELTQLRERRELLLAELAELEVTRAKYDIHAPAVATVVQTQFIWPGELAQPGTSVLSVLDPADKYVRVYVPVDESARLPVGQRVEIELDSEPGRRVPGEVSFVADQANFTPEKIETRRDRLGQVYRVKVRILEGVERFRPGTEGNVYPLDGTHG
jgi:HlyD family secretion protein